MFSGSTPSAVAAPTNANSYPPATATANTPAPNNRGATPAANNIANTVGPNTNAVPKSGSAKINAAGTPANAPHAANPRHERTHPRPRPNTHANITITPNFAGSLGCNPNSHRRAPMISTPTPGTNTNTNATNTTPYTHGAHRTQRR